MLCKLTVSKSGTSQTNVLIMVEEIAVLLDIGRSSAYELVKQGLFRTVKVGTAIRISKKSFDDWLDSQN